MDSSPTRRRTLQLGGTALVAGLAGCLGDDSPEGTLDFDGLNRVDEAALPDKQNYRTDERPFPTYRRYDADDADMVLILLHTAAFDSRILQPLATAISEAGVAHVVTPDLRGHGPNPNTRGDVKYIGQYEDDLRQLVDSVGLMYPDANVVIGGHGTGGGTVVRFAAPSTGSLADGYLLLAPYLGPDAPTTRQGLGGWANFYGDRIVMLRVLTGFGLDNYSGMTTVEFDIPASVRDDSTTLEHTYRLMASYTPDEGAVSEMVDVPTLTVAGTDDETADAGAYEPLFADREAASVEVLDGVSHLDTVLGDGAVDPIVDWLRILRKSL
jgi:alpha-beta hydrolase superfamily lysophospholipase